MIKSMENTKDSMAKDHALKFLKSHTTMVLASMSNNVEPAAATVYFVSDDNFNLFFLTSAKSKKADNLKTNGKVAFVIGWGPEIITIQGAGVAKDLPEKEAEIFFDLIKKNAFTSVNQWPILKFADEGYCAFKITPSWISYLNLNKELYPDIASNEFYKII